MATWMGLMTTPQTVQYSYLRELFPSASALLSHILSDHSRWLVAKVTGRVANLQVQLRDPLALQVFPDEMSASLEEMDAFGRWALLHVEVPPFPKLSPPQASFPQSSGISQHGVNIPEHNMQWHLFQNICYQQKPTSLFLPGFWSSHLFSSLKLEGFHLWPPQFLSHTIAFCIRELTAILSGVTAIEAH